MKKAFKILLTAVVTIILLSTVVSAAAPYTTYTYSSTGFVLQSPDAYSPDVVVGSRYIGPDVYGVYPNLADVRDICVGPKDYIYLSDAAEGCIYILDNFYKFKGKINSFVNEQGVPDGFNGLSGLYVTDEKIYACDSNNGRVVVFDLDGNFICTVNQPESALFSADTIYRPIAVAVDKYDRLFIVSATATDGVIVMDEHGNFYGYIGAQKVAVDAWQAFWREINPDSSTYETRVATEYNNITIDEDNFLFVTTDAIDESAQQSAIASKDISTTNAPVKKLNASGKDVMRRNGFYPPSGEVKVSTSSTSAITGASQIVDAAVGPEGTWSIIDQKRSKVFTYNANGELLFAFGDSGNQIGSISKVVAVTYQGNNLILLDGGNSTFTVYRRTEYGDILLNALHNNNMRDYEAAVDDWKEILKRNNNFDTAYLGIAESLYKEKEFAKAEIYYKAAFDIEGCSKCYTGIRKEWLSKFFLVVPVVIVAALVGVVNWFAYAKKKNQETQLKVGQKNIKEELMYGFYLIFHPFDGFWDLKHEKRGSPRSAYIIFVFTVLAFLYKAIGTGYYIGGEVSEVSVFGTLLSVALPLILWIIANWCLTTLFDGEGTFGDVFVATCYATIPIPLLFFPMTLISNVLTADEAVIVSTVDIIAFGWAAVLLFFGMMSTHGYSLGKNILTIIGTIVGMVFIMFIAVLFSTLITKVVSFVYNIVQEIQYRI